MFTAVAATVQFLAKMHTPPSYGVKAISSIYFIIVVIDYNSVSYFRVEPRF
jgi:hypothetical protein